MHTYEVIFIIRPDAPEEEVTKVVSQMEGYVTGAGGTVVKTEKLGRRKLAYRIQRHREGFYLLFELEGSPNTVHELERRLKVADAVIKFLTVRVDEERKRAAKLAALRAKKQAKRPKAGQQAHETPSHESSGGAPDAAAEPAQA